MTSLIHQRWGRSIPFLLALIVLIGLIWNISINIYYPHDGISDFQSDGSVIALDENGPAFGHLQAGDLILSINNIPLAEAIPYYKNKHAGDVVHYVVDRKGQQLSVDIVLTQPNVYEILRRLVPTLVALIFWIVGIGVLAFAPVSLVTTLCFLFCLTGSAFLVFGSISTMSTLWAYNVYRILYWLAGPVSVHFHLNFPQSTSFRWKKILISGLYFIGVSGSIPYIIWSGQELRISNYFLIISSAVQLFVAINLLIILFLLFYAYRHPNSAGVHGKIRIVLLGGLVGTLPLIMLTLLPNALFHQPVQSTEFAFIWIAILPLAYGYAIFRFHLIEIEKHINRGAAYILVYSILGGVYLILYSILRTVIPLTSQNEPFVNTIIVLILASLLVPLYRKVQIVVDTLFYGGWYDYRSAVTQISQGLEQITEMQELAQIVSERLVNTLHLEDTCVFLSDTQGNFSIISVSPRVNTPDPEVCPFPSLPRSSLEYLLNIGAVEKASLKKALSEITLSPEEHQLLNSEQVHLWVPVLGHGQIQGFLALGPKFGGDIFSAEDMDILRVVARQMGPVIENIQLLNRLKEHAADLEARVIERTAELYDAKERVEAILASVGDGVFVTDLSGNIQTINAAFQDQSGFALRDVFDKSYLLLLDEHNNPEVLNQMSQALENGETWSGELISRRKSGNSYDIQLTIAPVLDQNGKMVNYVGSQRDITRQKEFDRLKDMFVADVSHELRTPTTNINLYLELLEFAPREKWGEYLSILREQGLLLRGLVEDILDLSRLAIVKEKKAEFNSVNLNLLADQVVTANRPLAESFNLTLNIEPDGHLPLVWGDQNQLSRVITNLISNAIRYTPQGSIWVRTYQKNSHVCIDVEDTGIGIDPEDMPHLFERFYRGKQVRQSKIHGTGLGLAIVKEILEMHNGEISVDSEVGKRTIFTVEFPICENESLLADRLT